MWDTPKHANEVCEVLLPTWESNPPMIIKGHKIESSKIVVLGSTFKENCQDIRNSRVIDVIEDLKEFGWDITVSDYWTDKEKVNHKYNLNLYNYINNDDYKVIVMAVSHDKYKNLTFENKDQVVYDIQSILNNSDGGL